MTERKLDALVRSERWRRLAPWLVLAALAAALHLWGLGERTFHHDEAIHAKLSWDLWRHGSYHYDPTYHGPLLYFTAALTYVIAGASDFTARLPAALAGIGMVWVAWRLRRSLGGRAAWWTGLLFTLSPIFLYFGRFERMDLPEALFASGALLAFRDALRARRGSWAALGVWSGLAFATKENAYVTAALLGLTAAFMALDRGFLQAVPAAVRWLTARWTGIATAAATFVAVTLPLYTVGFTRPGDWLFPVRAITYWWGQHTVQRVGGPWWFHLPRLAQYEFLAIGAATVWVARRWRRLRPVELFLYLLGLTSVGMYCWLGEKVPWLAVHQVWPFVPLAGAQLAHTFGPHGRRAGRIVAVLALAATVVTTVTASFVLDEITPARRRVESLIFVQTCPEVGALVREITAAAAVADEAPAIAVSGEASWPLTWYLRDISVQWSLPTPGRRPAIVVCDLTAEPDARRALGPGYTRERIPLRAWWLMAQARPTVGQVLRYLFTRIPWGGIGSTDVVVLRRGSGEDTSAIQETETPAVLADALGVRMTTTIGSGFMGEPRGIALRESDLAVADASLGQVLRLSVTGAVGGTLLTGELNQPESVAWRRPGEVVIADTWNQRVLVASFAAGVGPTDLAAPEGGWYGPRGVALSPEGRLAVTDTGNKRVVVYDAELANPRVAAGGLDEPVGIAWLDARRVLVCDTGHHRLVTVNVDDGSETEIQMPEAWSDYYSRPQVVVLGPGRWLASDTPAGSLWLVEDGRVRRLDLRPAGIAPTGLAWDGERRRLVIGDLQGKLWVLEVDDG